MEQRCNTLRTSSGMWSVIEALHYSRLFLSHLAELLTSIHWDLQNVASNCIFVDAIVCEFDLSFIY